MCFYTNLLVLGQVLRQNGDFVRKFDFRIVSFGFYRRAPYG
uniref:Uncharacterized protein n=1 Tax=Leptospira santarosai serovar Arenal str. MAVJ 401 TaxID=1049976 RepID=M6JQB0_9LEPT|nr:hypothetical protein LEP1GSC063_3700 [Leptospira santarosai serovar Arenal str. MAVJ 401]